jgi:hypothetical protein
MTQHEQRLRDAIVADADPNMFLAAADINMDAVRWAIAEIDRLRALVRDLDRARLRGKRLPIRIPVCQCGETCVAGEDQFEDAWICPKCIVEVRHANTAPGGGGE